MAGAALLHRTLELFEQLLLLRRQVHRRFDTDAAIKIAGVSAAHVAHALAAESEEFFALGAGRDFDRGTTIQSRHLEIATQHRCGETHGHLAIEIVLLALEQRMRLEPDLHEQIARGSTIFASLTFSREANLITLIHTGGHFDRQRFGVLHPAGAMTGRTRVGDDLSGAMTLRTGLLDGKESLLHAHLAVAAAGAADRG